MALWESEGIKHLLEINHIRDGEIVSSCSEEYEHSEYGSRLNIYLSNEDDELKIVPYTLENFRLSFGKNFPERITELFAGIKNQRVIAYIGKYYMDSQAKGFRHINQYFFYDDKPAGCKLTQYQGPTWIGLLPMIDKSLRPFFEELKEIKPDALRSIENCVRLLETSVSEQSAEFR